VGICCLDASLSLSLSLSLSQCFGGSELGAFVFSKVMGHYAFFEIEVPALSADHADIMVHGSSAFRLKKEKKKKTLFKYMNNT